MRRADEVTYMQKKRMSDREFIEFCAENPGYCREKDFENRLLDRYPETIPDKDYSTSWKDYYLNVVRYIDLLKRDFDYTYTSRDVNPRRYYKALSKKSNSMSENQEQLNEAVVNGDLARVKMLVNSGVNVSAGDDYALIVASRNGNLPLVKFLVEHGANIQSRDNKALIWASTNGHLPVVKYLVENGANINAGDDEALRWARKNGHVSVFQYLESLN